MPAKLTIVNWLLLLTICCLMVVAWGLYRDYLSVHTDPDLRAPLAQRNEHERLSAAKQVNHKNRVNPLSIHVPVQLTADKRTVRVPLEQYVLGVVAAEMPARFSLEALKAQAIAARTYIVHQMMAAQQAGRLQSFFVSDTTADQVFLPRKEVESRWQKAANGTGLEKLMKAVHQTAGVIITYDERPIQATYFSTSNGYTESAADYWGGNPVPYLQSVASPWDVKLSNRYRSTIRFSSRELFQRLGLAGNQAHEQMRSLRAVGRTDGQRVKFVQIAGRTIESRRFREKLGLRSTHFDWRFDGDEVVFTTYGYGHGVGMSQWGAQGMALAGYKAADIIRYYYQDVQLTVMNRQFASLVYK